MTKPYNPRNPYSNSSYCKRHRREESQRRIQEFRDKGIDVDNTDMTGAYILIEGLFLIILGFIYLIGGSEALIDWFLM
ncbi:hypothetical protein [Empedobacter sp. UBA7494]|uniref:hypothetical protein n=1 Tax=Empedobacter sp. UBA7494 TaxID=1946450 RepID=UPI0025BA69FC|nr:hypothetical protein [Empedobacter sp. UBA7494]